MSSLVQIRWEHAGNENSTLKLNLVHFCTVFYEAFISRFLSGFRHLSGLDPYFCVQDRFNATNNDYMHNISTLPVAVAVS